MGLPNMQNQDLDLVLSTDAKPRLKWTPELHKRFVDAVIQLGGPNKATPKSLMKAMGIPGLTLYHLKSHLQKYRLGKNQQEEACSDLNKKDCKDNKGELDLFSEGTDAETHPINKSAQIARSVQVQRELHEQIEVQKHLQLRIEAQGKYLQKVMKKAQETLVAYTSSMGAELAQDELSQLFSVVNYRCSSPTESSLTSCETSGSKDDKEPKILEDDDDDENKLQHTPILLALLDKPTISHPSDHVLGRKRKGSPSYFGEKAASKKLSAYKEDMGSGSDEIGIFGTLDLNNQYQEGQNLGQTTIDLNSIG